MKFLIPTAKEMTTPKHAPHPLLDSKAAALVQTLSQLDSDQLAKLYKINPDAAIKEWGRWQDLVAGRAHTAPAITLFNGLMYRQLADRTAAYLGQRVLITSALYGVIPADQLIAPHRLDFQQAIKIEGQGLKAYWRPAYDAAIADQDLLISLLSSEFEDIFSKTVRERFITVRFHEEKAGQLKTHSTISKKGRGLLLNQACLEAVENLDQLKQLTFAGFVYRADLSSARELVYVKTVD